MDDEDQIRCDKCKDKPKQCWSCELRQDDIDYHKPDASGYSRADEEWFFGMDDL